MLTSSLRYLGKSTHVLNISSQHLSTITSRESLFRLLSASRFTVENPFMNKKIQEKISMPVFDPCHGALLMVKKC